MEFYPSCRTRLTLTRNNGNTVFSCSRCGFQKSANSRPVDVKKVANRGSREDIVVIGREEQKLRTTPTAKVECPECGNKLAYTWQVQTRSGDEGGHTILQVHKMQPHLPAIHLK